MKLFARLYRDLDETTKTSRKVDALARYFVEARPQDAAWALHFLSGRRIKRLLPAATLAHLALETAGISEWLFGECIDAVGDLAEAAALILPQPTSAESVPLAVLIEERVLPLRTLDEEARRALLSSTWALLGVDERLVFHKILTGAFRVGVSELLVLRGIEQASGVDTATLKHRTMGDWTPTADFWSELVATSSDGDEGTASERVRASRPDRPYPFALAHPLEGGPQSLGEPAEWQIEWKWDGIRGQLVRRDGIFVWSRGEELVSAQFPEIVEAAEVLPRGVVLDGEILPWRDGVLGFGDLQRRLNRKKIDVKMRAEIPIVFLAYDLLEHESVDVRALPITERRALLDQVLDAHPHERLMRSEVIAPEGYATWDELTELREESRARNVEGFMLKRRTSAYGVGRKRGDWWKWKIDPYAVDAVLVYAQHGSGKRASLYTDYTFAVWRDVNGTASEERELVTFAKAYSGLTDDEIKEVDAFVRKNTVEKFGPVRHVKPELVFEIGFEGIAESKRHKSGVAVRFPRMLRWRKDKPAREADTVESLRALLG